MSASFKEFANDTIKHAQDMLGECLVREWLKRKKIPHAQVDVICKRGDKWFLFEIKHQERFTAPPFDGHGLPKWQLDMRLKFGSETGVEPWLVVVEPPSFDRFYMQSMAVLDSLPQEKKHQTNGQNPRVVFPLDSFKQVTVSQSGASK